MMIIYLHSRSKIKLVYKRRMYNESTSIELNKETDMTGEFSTYPVVAVIFSSFNLPFE